MKTVIVTHHHRRHHHHHHDHHQPQDNIGGTPEQYANNHNFFIASPKQILSIMITIFTKGTVVVIIEPFFSSKKCAVNVLDVAEPQLLQLSDTTVPHPKNLRHGVRGGRGGGRRPWTLQLVPAAGGGLGDGRCGAKSGVAGSTPEILGCCANQWYPNIYIYIYLGTL